MIFTIFMETVDKSIPKNILGENLGSMSSNNDNCLVMDTTHSNNVIC